MSLTILNIQRAREISRVTFVSRFARVSFCLESRERSREFVAVKPRRFDPTGLAVWVSAAFYEPAISLALLGLFPHTWPRGSSLYRKHSRPT